MNIRIFVLCLLAGAGSIALQFPARSQSLAGQCRQSNRRLDVYSQPSVNPGSQTVGTLEANVQVILAGNGQQGWISIRQPVEGFVIARHLTKCTETPTSTPSQPSQPQPQPSPSPVVPITPALTNIREGGCRLAIVDLAIRSRPNAETGSEIGSVKKGSTATLTGNTSNDPDGRFWLQISAPVRGWISGGRSGGSNVILCDNRN
ncbi:MAG: SH3 domain-containing protein [Cyanobacteria bacterium SBLK]|nr:SH3 domain-containing protein [Cyanobacteria bacterium SBLK]